MVFASSSERPVWPEVTPLRLPATSSPASHGIRSERVPLLRLAPARPLPVVLPRPSASRFPPSGPVPSSWFRTTSTVFSAHGVPGLLHPGAGRGSQCFKFNGFRSAPGDPKIAGIRPEVRSHSHCALHTPRRSPPDRSRSRVTALPCPLAVRPLQWFPTEIGSVLQRPSTSRLFSAVGSVARFDRCQSMRALSFHGLLFPSRVLASEADSDPARLRTGPAPTAPPR